MTSVCRAAAAALAFVVPGVAAALTLPPQVPCDRPYVVFDGGARMASLPDQSRPSDYVARLRSFLRRACDRPPTLHVERSAGASLALTEPTIVATIERTPRVVAIVHSPYADLESGAGVAEVLARYDRILAACARSGAICLIGGQQPVNSMQGSVDARQVELEREALRAYGIAFVPLHRHFESTLASRRLLFALDSGDGRALEERGHVLLFSLYRARLVGRATDR